MLPESGRGHSDIETVICETIRSVGVKLSWLDHTVPADWIKNDKTHDLLGLPLKCNNWVGELRATLLEVNDCMISYRVKLFVLSFFPHFEEV